MSVAQVSIVSPINHPNLSTADSIQRIIQESVSKEAPRATSSARRMRAASVLAQKTVESQMERVNEVTPFTLDENAPLTPENARLAIDYLDDFISKSLPDFVAQLIEGSDSSFTLEETISFYKEIFGLERVLLHMYLGNTDEVVAYLKSHEEIRSDDDDVRYMEGQESHAMLTWLTEGDMSQLVKLASEDNRVALLLLKAKGIPLPETDDVVDYEEAVQLLNTELNDEDLSWLERDRILQERAFSKAMAGDYEGALQEYNELIASGTDMYTPNIPLFLGLIQFLNHDLESARATLSLTQETTMMAFLGEHSPFSVFLGTEKQQGNIFAQFALTKILGL